MANFIDEIKFICNKNKYIFSPIFIIGCGRSGTTLLGNTISHHPEIRYLNEPRKIWHKVYPEFNIWEHNFTKPKLQVQTEDICLKKTNQLKTIFFKEQVISNSKLLLEKLPINCFRLNFLHQSFPNAKYIYITRNGLEVSYSISKKIEKENWHTGEKENLLMNLAHKNKIEFPVNINNQEKGMLEWRLSMEHSHKFFKNFNRHSYLHFSYESFVKQPKMILQNIFTFLELSFSDELIIRATKKIRRSNNIIRSTQSENLKELGGDFLSSSINDSYSPI
ncbi:MAG: hypothetical protein CMP51_02960 [Flavobacteriales bacterium]|nr:hypothetical protein [Flavobacteriales bacterium]